MRTVREVSRLTEAGYRLYDDADLERLQSILLFRELQFPLKEIRAILDSPDFDRNRALEQQIALLTMKKEHLENLINFAVGIKAIGVRYLNFKAFDTSKIDEYADQAKAAWGHTEAYHEYEEKSRDYTQDDIREISDEMMELLCEFGRRKGASPAEDAVQQQVKKLQDFITEHFYTCTREILHGLGRMYSGGGSITENIDDAAGKGTAEFVAQAIEIYCGE